MNLFDLDKNPHTLENDLVNRVRRCWHKRPYPDNYGRNNLKDAIRELRTFRTNRGINPELHAKLDAGAVDCFNSQGLLGGYTEKAWHTYCHNKHILTRTRIDEPRQESLIDGLPVSMEQPKGRARTRPPAEKISREYYEQTRTEIENGNLTPYLPVRQMLGFIHDTDEQKSFISTVRILAKIREDDQDHRRDFKRIHRVASRVMNELHETSRQVTFF